MATKTERKIVAPSPKSEHVLAFAIPIPAWLQTSAIEVGSNATMPADLRQALEARLGCLFTVKNGDVRTADGRRFALAVKADRIEVLE